MELKEYIKINDFPNVRKLGKINGTTYYIEKNIPDNEDIGIPFVICEKSGNFSVCTSDEVLRIINILGDETL